MLLSALFVTSTTEDAVARATCLGRAVTIFASPGAVTVGTAGPDVILGTAGRDVIRGAGGGDRICSLGGADIVAGGSGDDLIDLGRGADVGRGGAGDDRIRGNGGTDQLRGNRGSDTLAGGRGDDQIRGGRGRDTLRGGGGDDVVSGERGRDRIRGNQGADSLSGGAGPDDLAGGPHDDTLHGDGGPDVLRGGPGFDSCDGGPGVDAISSCETAAVPRGASCAVDADLTTWSEALFDNSWLVSSNQAVHQENGRPTMLISPDGRGCRTVAFSGTLRVGNSDGDWIGFGLGMTSPLDTCREACPVEGIFLSWRSTDQAFCGAPASDAPAGWTVRRVEGTVDVGVHVSSSCAEVYPVFGDVTPNDPRVQVLAAGVGSGWVVDTTYTYTVEYSPTKLRLVVDGAEIMDVSGSFPIGSVALFNLSQEAVVYTVTSFSGS